MGKQTKNDMIKKLKDQLKTKDESSTDSNNSKFNENNEIKQYDSCESYTVDRIKESKREYFTTHQAANFLYVTPTTVIQWIKEGRINVIKTAGGHRRILKQELIKFAEALKTGTE